MRIDLENGIYLNVEEYGNKSGYPIFFLHGNRESHEIFAYFFDKLIEYRLVFVDSRCHGKSVMEAELDYDLMKDDILGLADKMGIERFSLVGFSDGAIVSIITSLSTNRIDRMFLIGPNLNPLGLTDECLDYFKKDFDETGSVYSKMCLEEPDIDPISLRDVSARAIIIGGQLDLIKREHLELINKSFKNSTLYVIANATHFIPQENSEELLEIIENELSVMVYYEDNHVIVVEKPAGILSQEDDSKDSDILNITKKYLKIKYHKEGNVYLGLVQRLDRNVSGLMAFAKTSKAAARLNAQRPKKKYMASVYGTIDKKEGSLIDYIMKDEEKRTAYRSDNGKIAILKYRVIDEVGGMSLLDVEIETGRFHQIRFQLSSMGHPIYNDFKYGGKNEGMDGIGLDAYSVSFNHPVRQDRIEISRRPLRQPFVMYKIFYK